MKKLLLILLLISGKLFAQDYYPNKITTWKEGVNGHPPTYTPVENDGTIRLRISSDSLLIVNHNGENTSTAISIQTKCTPKDVGALSQVAFDQMNVLAFRADKEGLTYECSVEDIPATGSSWRTLTYVVRVFHGGVLTEVLAFGPETSLFFSNFNKT